MSEEKTNENNRNSYSPNKALVLQLLILTAIVTVTATFTYAFTSSQYLDEIDSQNNQIRTLQNVIRKSNGLTEIEGI